MKFSNYDSRWTLEKILTMNGSYLFDRKSIETPIFKLAKAMLGFANADDELIGIGVAYE